MHNNFLIYIIQILLYINIGTMIYRVHQTKFNDILPFIKGTVGVISNDL